MLSTLCGTVSGAHCSQTSFPFAISSLPFSRVISSSLDPKNVYYSGNISIYYIAENAKNEKRSVEDRLHFRYS